MAVYGSSGLLTTGRVSRPAAAVKCPVLPLQRQRTSRHMALIKRHLNGTPVRARGEGCSLAVAITDRELLIGRARLFGSRLERFNLGRVVHLRTIESLYVDLLQVTLAGMPLEYVSVMYPPASRASFAHIRAMLETRLRGRKLKRRRRSVSMLLSSRRASRASGPEWALRVMAPIVPASTPRPHPVRRWGGSGLVSCLVSALINVLSMT